MHARAVLLLLPGLICACDDGESGGELAEVSARLDALEAENASQAETIAALEAEVAVLSGGVDLTELADAIAQNAAGIAANSSDITTNAADITTNSAGIAANAADIATLDSMGLSFGTTVYGSYAIENSIELSLLKRVEEITSFMSISDTDGLTGLEGLESLTTIGGGLIIQDNDSLISLDALSSLSSVGGSLSIINNDSLCQSFADVLISRVSAANTYSYGNKDDC